VKLGNFSQQPLAAGLYRGILVGLAAMFGAGLLTNSPIAWLFPWREVAITGFFAAGILSIGLAILMWKDSKVGE
jgi:hypothetical protein